jgi:hypothetical protein
MAKQFDTPFTSGKIKGMSGGGSASSPGKAGGKKAPSKSMPKMKSGK